MMPSAPQPLPMFLAALLASCQWLSAGAAEPSVDRLNHLVATGKLDEAAKLARQLDGGSDVESDLTLPLARVARAFHRDGNTQAAAEFYHRSVDASTRSDGHGLSPQGLVVLRLATSTVLTDIGRFSEAIDALEPILTEPSPANDQQQTTAVAICLRVGSASLRRGRLATASQAYALAHRFAKDDQKPTAMLGDAWVTAIGNQQPLEAARKLGAFTDRYPQHTDAPRAARARVECLRRAGRSDDASITLADLLQRWPDSEAAAEMVRGHSHLAVDLVPAAVRSWLMRKANANELASFDEKLTVLGLLIASQDSELAAWTNLARHLASIDLAGTATSDLLDRLVDRGNAAEAERLAAMFVSPKVDDRDEAAVSAAASEAACRWAGRTQRWSMLALAAETVDLRSGKGFRSAGIERLMAESLMQTDRVDKALAWWVHLVDQRGAVDFPTLLRCAEAETAVGRDSARAERRIHAARQAAGQDAFGITLVDLLDAELAIRRAQLDRARGLLEKVVRASETEAQLRGRAQWLIGETHYLQRSFSKAIEAYRLVEGMDPGGIWVSASLIQAGKSFEQLGRTREAAVCYGHLISRFADTAHAALARRRLAAIEPGDNSSNSNSSGTIRR